MTDQHRMQSTSRRAHAGRAVVLALLAVSTMLAACHDDTRKPVPVSAVAPVPSIVVKNGRTALMVDGAPFVMLGAQANNSSNYTAVLPQVWPALEKLGANTLEIPVAWEQVEPVEGRFDFSYVDTLVKEARAHDMRLVLLWFATWKNTGPAYAPAWVKTNNARFPRMRDPKGNIHYALSPNFRSTLEADKKAFVALMSHLKAVDDKRTVIMVQVENEPGTYRLVRDYGPEAQKLFDGPAPSTLVAKLGKKPGSWKQAFGGDADEYFHAWSVASYIGEVAAAGQKVYPLPMYANAALRDPVKKQDPATYAAGGPTWNVLDIWHLAAPSLFTAAPDIYSHDYATSMGHITRYSRPDNPLLIVEIGSSADFPRYFFPALGRKAVGFSPFGIDFTGYSNFPLGAKAVTDETIAPFAAHYAAVKPMMREWAKLAFEADTWGVAEPDDHKPQVLLLGKWKATVSYGQWQFGESKYFPNAEKPEWANKASGGMLIARLGPDEFLVTGYRARINFDLADAKDTRHAMIDVVEEGHYQNGKWIKDRVWNGDQTDYGLNFVELPQVLRVKLTTY